MVVARGRGVVFVEGGDGTGDCGVTTAREDGTPSNEATGKLRQASTSCVRQMTFSNKR